MNGRFNYFFSMFILMFIALCLTPALADLSSPDAPPPLPPSAPPLIDYSNVRINDSSPDTTGKIAATYKLQPGWSIISFPMASVEKTTGFTYMIYRYSAGEYIPFDPVNHPEGISTKHGYLAWCDQPSEIQAYGTPNTGQVRNIGLTQGWNLIGFPVARKANSGKLIVTEGDQARTMREAMTPDQDGVLWISPFIYNSSSLSTPVNLLTAQGGDPIGKGFWVYAYQNCKLTVAGRPSSSAAPVVNSVEPCVISPGGRTTISGTGFGTVKGYVTIDGSKIPDSFVTKWTDTKIILQVPSYMDSGILAVCAGSSLSNTVPLTVNSSVVEQPLSGTLAGKVEDNDRQPLNGARVMLDNGMFDYTDVRGAYIIKNVPEGTQGIIVSKNGYRTATGKVTITNGQVNKTLIALSTLTDPIVTPGNATPPPVYTSSRPAKSGKSDDKPKLGNLTVVVDAYDDGYHRWWPRKVQVVESGNANYSWYKDWDNDLGDATYEIYCDGVRVGKTYTIKVFWASKNGGTPTYSTWDRKIYSTDQTETIDSLN